MNRDDADDWIAELHNRKTDHYVAALNSGGVPLRPGVKRLINEAREQDIRLAIATTTTPVNVKALIENTLGPAALDWFQAIGAGDCVDHLKPAPDVYLWVLDKMGLNAGDCLAIEDSHNGLKAARAAGLQTLITWCPYTADHDFDGALAITGGLDVPGSDGTVIDVKMLRKLFGG